MPGETYQDKKERNEPCSCKSPKIGESEYCLNCGGKIEFVREEEFGIWKGAEIYKHSAGKEVPIIEGLFNEGDFVCVQSEGGIGKSVLGQQWKFNLTTGRAFLNLFPINKKYKVLWNMGESKKRKHVRRLNDMKRAMEIDDNYWWFNNCCDYALENREDYERFRDKLSKVGVKFDIMFFDSMYGFYDEDFNNNKYAKKFCKHMRELSGEYDCTMVFFHHVNKDVMFQGKKVNVSKRVAGAKEWDAFFTTVFTLEKRATGLHYLCPTKDRDGDSVGDIPMYMVIPQDDRHKRLFFTQEVDQIKKHGNANKLKVLTLLKEKSPRYPDELYYPKNNNDKTDPRVSKSSYYSIIKQLDEDGLIGLDKDESGNDVVYLKKGGWVDGI